MFAEDNVTVQVRYWAVEQRENLMRDSLKISIKCVNRLFVDAVASQPHQSISTHKLLNI